MRQHSNMENKMMLHKLELLLSYVQSSIKDVKSWAIIGDDETQCSACYAQGVEDAADEFGNIATEIRYLIHEELHEVVMKSKIEVHPQQLALFEVDE